MGLLADRKNTQLAVRTTDHPELDSIDNVTVGIHKVAVF